MMVLQQGKTRPVLPLGRRLGLAIPVAHSNLKQLHFGKHFPVQQSYML